MNPHCTRSVTLAPHGPFFSEVIEGAVEIAAEVVEVAPRQLVLLLFVPRPPRHEDCVAKLSQKSPSCVPCLIGPVPQTKSP